MNTLGTSNSTGEITQPYSTMYLIIIIIIIIIIIFSLLSFQMLSPFLVSPPKPSSPPPLAHQPTHSHFLALAFPYTGA
jgi:amino acid transporter